MAGSLVCQLRPGVIGIDRIIAIPHKLNAGHSFEFIRQRLTRLLPIASLGSALILIDNARTRCRLDRLIVIREQAAASGPASGEA